MIGCGPCLWPCQLLSCLLHSAFPNTCFEFLPPTAAPPPYSPLTPFAQTGCPDIVVGRDDGQLEVWDVDEGGLPYRVFTTQVHESISAVAGGYITSPTSQDILVHTFSGKVRGQGN